MNEKKRDPVIMDSVFAKQADGSLVGANLISWPDGAGVTINYSITPAGAWEGGTWNSSQFTEHGQANFYSLDEAWTAMKDSPYAGVIDAILGRNGHAFLGHPILGPDALDV